MAGAFPVESVRRQLQALGAKDVLIKHLVRNNNSKNQIYLKGDITALSLLPMGEVELKPGTSKKKRGKKASGPILWCPIDLWWLSTDGRMCPAPHTKLILYPQYSEARLSGFILGGKNAPGELFNIEKRGYEPGRILMLAPLPDGRVIACVYTADSVEASAIKSNPGEPYGVLQRYEVQVETQEAKSSREMLIAELRRINRLGWLDPVQLQKDGSWTPCRRQNCGGVTLETHLGIRPNGYAEPDFHGWEVKQHGVKSWGSAASTPITLMTPEPSGGLYHEEGAASFIRAYGYPDKQGKPDRLNFGGRYIIGGPADRNTTLRMDFVGYDKATGEYTEDAAIVLLDPRGQIAASWSFVKLMNHWKKKHAKAAYVSSMMKKEPPVKYCYGSRVQLAEGGSFNSLLKAFTRGTVFYDPGLKLEYASAKKPIVKCRNQFRVPRTGLGSLYETTETIEI